MPSDGEMVEAFWHGAWWSAKVISRKKRKRDGSIQYKVLFDDGGQWDTVAVVRRKGGMESEKSAEDEGKVCRC